MGQLKDMIDACAPHFTKCYYFICIDSKNLQSYPMEGSHYNIDHNQPLAVRFFFKCLWVAEENEGLYLNTVRP